MEPLKLQTIVEFAGAALRQGDPGRSIGGIATDSRDIRRDELFLALRGDRFDGHQFVETAVAKGAAGAIVSAGFAAESLPATFALIEAADPLTAYQQVAARYRRMLPLKLVAITGSNGKTSTKDLAAAVLGTRYRVLKTRGNFNNHLGVPLTLLRASAHDDYAVVEMGMNHPGEIAPLAKMAAPSVAVITNVGTAHLEFMLTREAIAQEKGMLAEAIDAKGTVVLSAEDEFTESISRRTDASIITVGFTKGDIRAQDVRHHDAGTAFTVTSADGHAEVYLPVPGRHMVLNSLLAIAVGQTCGLKLEECVGGLARLDLTKGRMEFKEVGGLRILDDSYNANPDSMIAALDTLAQLPVRGRRIAVLGQMGELGHESEAGHRRVGEAAARVHVDQVIAVGPDARYIVENAHRGGVKEALNLDTLEEAACWISDHARPDDLVLLKGSRSAGMERILTFLNPNLPSSPAHTSL